MIKSNSETTKEKILIAEFLGWERYDHPSDKEEIYFCVPNLYPSFNIDDPENTGYTTFNTNTFLFDVSWDWLIPACKKWLENADFVRKNPNTVTDKMYKRYKVLSHMLENAIITLDIKFVFHCLILCLQIYYSYEK